MLRRSASFFRVSEAEAKSFECSLPCGSFYIDVHEFMWCHITVLLYRGIHISYTTALRYKRILGG